MSYVRSTHSSVYPSSEEKAVRAFPWLPVLLTVFVGVTAAIICSVGVFIALQHYGERKAKEYTPAEKEAARIQAQKMEQLSREVREHMEKKKRDPDYGK